MATKVVMPRLSLTMKEGTVAEWFKKEGETVTKGEPLVEVLSEKATVDVEAPAAGILRKILVGKGVDVPVNATLAIIATSDEQLTEADIESLSEETEEEKKPIEVPEVKTEVTLKAEERVVASPAAKRLAREHGIDLGQVKGTGPEGRIVEEDVQIFVQQASQTVPRVKEVIPLIGIKKTTAERVSRSFRTAPHSTVIMEVDMTNATKLRGEKQISYTELLVKAVAEALKRHPLLNSTLAEDESIKVYEDVNVGVAVATEQGLVVPVVHSADKKTLEEIAEKLRDLAEKAREGKLTKEDVNGGTFTITNLGMFGVDLFMPIINPPEAAILAVGRISDKPVVEGKEIKIKPVMTLSLAYDHRIVDGAPAARFLQEIKRNLET
ncbi:MAG TPA: dihydrolipoamide acetyltransferase family protein [Candidatus Krumholzibacteriaceae bacterium]|jgi:pyruvate dehydrogenase E2 component (dihydrolipoamide acetyltransferase)|nr:dihydrolipoamide acetyltransferase family protein [Candidatus Krumholzibacteriaceae bacterium]